ncbi:MAG TPA: MauE/DoxX family redox-associated membrane protein [Bryobacteraceae bacterium]|nr:MauE/DoxX family redox-associated membrane protein [Bryobacteraceae bacterium]
MAASRRTDGLRISIGAGLVAGFLLSPKLWLTSRSYPLVPVFRFLRPVPPPWDYGVMASLILLAVWIAIRPKPVKAIAAFVLLAAAYGLFDQSRWQPWLYQYLFMLAALAIYSERDAVSITTCRWMVAAIYFWSGVHKANAGFIEDTFPRLMEPFGGLATLRAVHVLALAVPAIEAAIGMGLLTRRFRTASIIGALGMHAFILASVGPLGHDWDRVIWPWNLAMAAIVVLLFWRNGDATSGGSRAFQGLVLVLFGIAPVLSFVNLMDGYPAFSLYSGNPNDGTIYMADSVADRLPEEIQEQIDVNDSGVDELSILGWSYEELGVPPYGELRVLRSIGRQVCEEAGNPREMVLIVQTKSTWIRTPRSIAYGCESLRK